MYFPIARTFLWHTNLFLFSLHCELIIWLNKSLAATLPVILLLLTFEIQLVPQCHAYLRNLRFNGLQKSFFFFISQYVCLKQIKFFFSYFNATCCLIFKFFFFFIFLSNLKYEKTLYVRLCAQFQTLLSHSSAYKFLLLFLVFHPTLKFHFLPICFYFL